jgi:transposase, IS6 family
MAFPVCLQLSRYGKTPAGNAASAVDHTTVFRWLQQYTPELDKRCRPSRRGTNDSYRADETYIQINKPWHYLYKAVDSQGQMRAFMLSTTRAAEAAARFFRKVLGATHTTYPRVITMDGDAAYLPAVDA